MQKLFEKIEKLERIYDQVKQLNRCFRICTLTTLRDSAYELYEEISRILIKQETQLKDDVLTKLTKKARDLYFETNKYIKIHFERHPDSFNTTLSAKEFLDLAVKESKSDKMGFDIKEASALVPMYNGSQEALGAFLAAAKLLQKINPDMDETIVPFLYTRLTGDARIGLPENLTTCQELLEDIKQRCQEKTDPKQIISEMKAVQTKNTKGMCKEIELLAAKLKGLYREEGFPEKAANKMVVEIAVDTLKEKVSNPETVTILKTINFATVAEATQKALQNETEVASKNAKVYSVNYTSKQPYRKPNNSIK